MSPRNLVLVGMPGSGKSTIGVLVAKGLGWDFVDTDLLLQRKHDATLAVLLERHGNAGFLALENQLLSELDFDRTVVATGGSACYHDAGMSHLGTIGTVAWIDVPLKELERRLGNLVARGVVLGPGQTLKDLYELRTPLYSRWSAIRVPVAKEDLETSVSRVLNSFRASLATGL